jgi:filamentous hemagglutinin family protein
VIGWRAVPKSGSDAAGHERVRCALLAPALGLVLAAPAPAQVVFDGSLGAAGAAPSAPGIDFLVEQDRGALVGANLFHSFSEFSIPEGTRAEFTALVPIDNVIAKVTGTSISQIDGTLSAATIPGGPDFFLLNPNGVLFGQTAVVDVPASFHVATADSLHFADGSELIVRDLDAPTLSAFPPSAFGYLPGEAGDVSFPLRDPSIDTQPLVVAPGATLTVVAGDVTLENRGTYLAPGGVIQLAAVGEAGVDVPLDLAEFAAREATDLGEVRIRDGTTVDTLDLVAPDAPQGRIVIRGESLAVERGFVFAGGDGTQGGLAVDAELSGVLAIENGSSVQAFTAGSPASGEVRLAADEVRVSDFSLALAQSFGSGRGGAVRVATRTLDVTNGSRLAAEAFGGGAGGALEIEATGAVSVRGLSEIATRGANGPGGALSIEAASVSASDGGQISTTTEGSGNAGALTLSVAGDVVLSGAAEPSGLPSGLFARSGSGPGSSATGDGGELRVIARNLTLEDGALVSARTFGSGAGGDVVLLVTGQVSIGEESAISSTGQTGDGGDISVLAGVVDVHDGGQILASTEGAGDSGDISLDAGRVSVVGRSEVGARSAITAITTLPAALGTGGAAGVIDVDADEVVVADGGLVTTRSLGAGAANEIRIRTRDSLVIDGGELRSVAESASAAVDGGDIRLLSDGGIRLENGALVTAEALGAGDAGSIALEAAGRLDLDHSQVSTEARLALGGDIELSGGERLTLTHSEVTTSVQQGDGTGGDIDLGPRQVSLNASTVLARAVTGFGGNIRADASDSYLQSSDSRVDATATTDIGVDGTFVVDAPEADLAGDLARLPESFLDASRQLQRDCEIRTERAGSFVVRGAPPPPPPDDLLAPEPLPPSGAPHCDPR